MRVGAQEIKIGHMPSEDTTGDMGRWDWNTGEILLKANLPVETYSLTLLHEVLHVISDLYGLDLKESVVRVLEQGLGAWIQDNPAIVQDMINGIRGEKEDGELREGGRAAKYGQLRQRTEPGSTG